METQNTFNIEQKESIKLTKMTKGYNWEIKLIGVLDAEQMTRLEELNQKMEEDYGNRG